MSGISDCWRIHRNWFWYAIFCWSHLQIGKHKYQWLDIEMKIQLNKIMLNVHKGFLHHYKPQAGLSIISNVTVLQIV